MTYLLERIKDSYDWPKGIRIWSDFQCPGWRVIAKRYENGIVIYIRK